MWQMLWIIPIGWFFYELHTGRGEWLESQKKYMRDRFDDRDMPITELIMVWLLIPAGICSIIFLFTLLSPGINKLFEFQPSDHDRFYSDPNFPYSRKGGVFVLSSCATFYVLYLMKEFGRRMRIIHHHDRMNNELTDDLITKGALLEKIDDVAEIYGEFRAIQSWKRSRFLTREYLFHGELLVRLKRRLAVIENGDRTAESSQEDIDASTRGEISDVLEEADQDSGAIQTNLFDTHTQESKALITDILEMAIFNADAGRITYEHLLNILQDAIDSGKVLLEVNHPYIVWTILPLVDKGLLKRSSFLDEFEEKILPLVDKSLLKRSSFLDEFEEKMIRTIRDTPKRND